MSLRVKLGRIALLAAFLASGTQAQHSAGVEAGSGWALPNFSDLVRVSVSNPERRPLNALAILDIDAVRKFAPGFPGTLAIVVEDKSGRRFLPSQVDAGTNSSGDGQFVFAVYLAPHEQEQLSIYYSQTLRETLPWPKRVDASHSYGYNHATAAIESELIGYRTYGGFFLDVQAHRKDELGLFNALIGFSRISAPPLVGEDVIHLGDTLGLGGVFLRAGDEVFRPPFNTPDYTHRTAKPDEPTYRILMAGPLRALVEARLDRWNIRDDEVTLRAIYEMREGEEIVRCHFWIKPVHISHYYQVGAGVRDLPRMRRSDEPGLIALEGIQEPRVGTIALGLAYAPSMAQRAGELPISDNKNEIVLFDRVLREGDIVSGEYSVAAAWQGSGWSDPLSHLRQILRQQAMEPLVQVEVHEQNPRPSDIESEPQ